MSTFNGWPVVTMPSSPAPSQVEFSKQNIVSANVSPFTGQEQILDWGSSWLEATVTLPPMPAATAAAWVTFLVGCRGPVSVFQIANAKFASLTPTLINGYWRLKTNVPKWSINEAIFYGITFDMREAI